MKPGDRWALAGLAALVLGLLHEATLSGRAFFKWDVLLVWSAQVETVVRAVASGSWPLWNPYVSFGQPLLANANSQLLYPLSGLLLVLPSWTYYTVLVATHLLLAAAGLYALARRWGLSRPGSFVAAALWTVSGPLLSLVSFWNHLTAAAWIPWAMLAADRTCTERRATDALLWGAALAAQLLAGSPDMFVLTSLAGAAFALRFLDWRDPLGAASRALLGRAALAGTFALALSAGQWIPSLDAARRSERAGLPAEARAYWSVHPLGLLQTLLPAFPSALPWRLDEPLGPLRRFHAAELRAPYLPSLYLGLAAAGLVAASACRGDSGRRRFLGLTAMAAVLLALGRHGPLHDALPTLLPPLRMLRYPVKSMVLAAFAWALLAGMGFDAWRDGERWRRARGVALASLAAVVALCWGAVLGALATAERWGPLILHREPHGPSFTQIVLPVLTRPALATLIALALMLLVGLRRERPPARWSSLAAALLVVADPILAHGDLNPTAPREVFNHRPPTLDAVRQEDHSRLLVWDYSLDRGSWRDPARSRIRVFQDVPTGWPPLLAGVVAAQIYLQPPTGERWGLYGSYDLDLVHLYPAPVGEITSLFYGTEARDARLRLMRLGAVSQVVALHTEGLEDLVRIAVYSGLLSRPIHVFRVPDALPRTYAVQGVRVASGAGATQALIDPGFDPAREVVVPEGEPESPSPSFSGTSRILDLRQDRVRLEASLSQPGLVVLVDAYDPGWRAWVDGRETPVSRANVAFRAVRVPAGRHIVEYRYRPKSVILGLAVSGSALAACVALSRWGAS